MKGLITLTFMLVATCILSQHANGQRYLKNIIPNQNHISLTTSTNIHILAKITSKPSPEDYLSNHTWYYWYHKDTIIQAQGTYHGKLLHGEYKELFQNWKPKVVGKFQYGKKVGKWKYWDENGFLRKIGFWKESEETGPFQLYNEKGQLIQKGNMKGGQLHGIIKTYSVTDSAKIIKQRFKNGKPVPEDKRNSIQNLYDKFTTFF